MANRLSISNIAWKGEQDETVYDWMKELGFSGLEVAPTRILPSQPYQKLEQARQWAEGIKKEWEFAFPSIQSIWYGRSENIFAGEDDRSALLAYTKEAILFAEVLESGNLVFGCPRNRNLPEGAVAETAIPFFRELGEYAFAHGTAIGMEGTPAIYNTNYINDTASAIALIRQVGSEGFRLNLDMGTMVQNGEAAEVLVGNVALVNHVHISEPGLKPLQPRELHLEILRVLKAENYQGDISIEMGCPEDPASVRRSMEYVRDLYEKVMK